MECFRQPQGNAAWDTEERLLVIRRRKTAAPRGQQCVPLAAEGASTLRCWNHASSEGSPKDQMQLPTGEVNCSFCITSFNSRNCY